MIDNYTKEDLQRMVVRLLLEVCGEDSLEIFRMRQEQAMTFKQISEYMKKPIPTCFFQYRKVSRLIDTAMGATS